VVARADGLRSERQGSWEQAIRPSVGASREDWGVKTRTLLILAAVTGLLIVAAGALQIMLAR
jgi:hypothetical protein